MSGRDIEPDEEHNRRLGGVFRASPTNAAGETEISVYHGGATLKRQVGPELHHAAGAVHGAHLFKLLDDAAFFAANSLVRDAFVLTVSFNVHYMRPVAAGVLTAEGRVVRATRRVIWSEAELRDERGRLVATGTGTFLSSTVGLTADIGYA